MTNLAATQRAAPLDARTHPRTLDLADARVLRIPFGSEHRALLEPGPTCPDCATRRGSTHKPGCLVEQCPRVHPLTPLSDCGCLDRDTQP